MESHCIIFSPEQKECISKAYQEEVNRAWEFFYNENKIIMESTGDGRELYYGEKAVGIKFNPSELTVVDLIKRGFAVEIDRMDVLRKTSDSPEQKRLCSIAITELQGAQMWAVKAATWKD